MLTIKNKLVASGLAIGLMAAAASARATSVTQSFNIPLQPPGIQDISYQLFNSNLGALTSVTLELVLNGTADVVIFGGPGSFTSATTSFALTVTGPPVGPTTYITTSLSANIGAESVPSGGASFPGIPAHIDSGIITVPNIDWGSYQVSGGGTSLTDLVFTAGAATTTLFNASGPIGGGGNGNVGDPASFLTLIYNYQPPAAPGMPEPGAWALLVKN